MGITDENTKLTQIVCMNTTLAAAAGGLTAYFLTVLIDKIESVIALANGLLAGLVGITAGCNAVTTWGSLIIGFIAGCIFIISSKSMRKLLVDDPLDAFSVHGACGFWGVIAVGIFHEMDGLWAGKGELLGVQI